MVGLEKRNSSKSNERKHIKRIFDGVIKVSKDWIVVSIYEYRSECGYGIEYFESEQEALKYSEGLKEEELLYVAKVVHQFE